MVEGPEVACPSSVPRVTGPSSGHSTSLGKEVEGEIWRHHLSAGCLVDAC